MLNLLYTKTMVCLQTHYLTYNHRNANMSYKCILFLPKRQKPPFVPRYIHANIPLNSLPSLNISSALPALTNFPLPNTTQ